MRREVAQRRPAAWAEPAISLPSRFFIRSRTRFGGRAAHLVDDPAVGQEHHPVGVAGRARVVGDDHDGLAELVHRAAQDAQHLAAGAGVEVAGRLVAEDDLRPARRGPARTRRAAAGRRTSRWAGAPAGRRGRARSMTVSSQAWSGLRPAMSIGSVMFSIAVSVGTRLKDWKTKPIRSRRSAVIFLSDRPASSMSPIDTEPDVTAVQPGQAVHQGGLARPGRAHDRGELAAQQVDADARRGRGRRCRRSRRA